MALLTIHDEDRTLTDPQEINQFLEPFGIWYEKWDVEGRVSDDSSNEEILSAYGPEIERLKEKGGFVTADVINVTPETPGLDEMMDKFNKEHTHSEDEVRFTVKGSGVFSIHPEDGPVFGVKVESGDLINVPTGTKHWFELCGDRTIRCIRLFQDQSGWAPHYIEGSTLHEKYLPVCMGPDFIPPAGDIDPVVNV
ncbi:MAG: acireductone dioxygenase [Blastopirellula sp.]|nr:acireductone dioxygenase [Blastopirellula sp.]|tara:strand:+ start:87 stop:671 length:585 start_codon:yes stop_codon:yes gene_type:complete